MTSQIGHWIDGRRTPGTSGRTVAAFNPATGEHTGDVALASSEEVSASTEQTSASTQEISASAQTLASTAVTLNSLVGRFTVAV